MGAAPQPAGYGRYRSRARAQTLQGNSRCLFLPVRDCIDRPPEPPEPVPDILRRLRHEGMALGVDASLGGCGGGRIERAAAAANLTRDGHCTAQRRGVRFPSEVLRRCGGADQRVLRCIIAAFGPGPSRLGAKKQEKIAASGRGKDEATGADPGCSRSAGDEGQWGGGMEAPGATAAAAEAAAAATAGL